MTVEKDIWIFLSHSSADFEKVRLIRNYLEEKKCRPLMFYLKCLNSEEETFELIKREIDVRTRFVVCDSDNARASKWVRKEIEYITGKEPKRSYLRLDLTKPINELKTDIDLYVSKTFVYISYRRRDLDMVCQVKNRLAKYDVRVFVDADDLEEGVDFRVSLTQAIVHASNCGYFILICSDGLLSEWQKQELEVATKANAGVLVVATTKCIDPFLVDRQPPKSNMVCIDNCDEIRQIELLMKFFGIFFQLVRFILSRATSDLELIAQKIMRRPTNWIACWSVKRRHRLIPAHWFFSHNAMRMANTAYLLIYARLWNIMPKQFMAKVELI